MSISVHMVMDFCVLLCLWEPNSITHDGRVIALKHTVSIRGWCSMGTHCHLEWYLFCQWNVRVESKKQESHFNLSLKLDCENNWADWLPLLMLLDWKTQLFQLPVTTQGKVHQSSLKKSMDLMEVVVASAQSLISPTHTVVISMLATNIATKISALRCTIWARHDCSQDLMVIVGFMGTEKWFDGCEPKSLITKDNPPSTPENSQFLGIWGKVLIQACAHLWGAQLSSGSQRVSPRKIVVWRGQW